jgi:hypothetical protein
MEITKFEPRIFKRSHLGTERIEPRLIRSIEDLFQKGSRFRLVNPLLNLLKPSTDFAVESPA